MKYLGPTLDIHGGGQDLIFPHHTNEIAQSEAYTGKKFAKYWMHNGFVTINKEKMSKSLGNFFTIREILEKYSPDVVRFFLLSTHYRSPIDFSNEHLEQAKLSLERLYNTFDAIDDALKAEKPRSLSEEDKKVITQIEAHKKKFIDAMDDDFNTTEAIAALFELSKTVNRYIETSKINPKVLQVGLDIFEELGKIFNLFELRDREVPKEAEVAVEKMLKELKVAKIPETFDGKIQKLIDIRLSAREAKDFETSDKIRARLAEIGIVLEDQAEGARWKLK
jgi:cysteinyl-tRNA synthetase